MTTHDEAIKTYIRAQGERSPENIEALSAFFADDVVIATPRGSFEGKEKALASVGAPLTAPNFQQATWTEPKDDGNSFFITGRLPLHATQGGYDIRFNFDSSGHIKHVDQQTLPAPPLPPSPMVLSPELKQVIADAWNTNPILVAAVDPNGQPRLSLRGTVQATADDKLAFWARNADGGTIGGLEKNPLLTLFYRNPAARTTYYFYGRGHVTKDEAERRAVYDASPEPERLADLQYKGLAVIIELDKVEGVTLAGRIHLARGA